MRAYIFLVVILSTVCTSWAGVMVGAPNKDYPNQCYVESIKEAFAVGEHTPKGKCMQVSCRKDFSYEINTCGRFTINEPGYHNEIDYTKPYPKCCIHLVKD